MEPDFRCRWRQNYPQIVGSGCKEALEVIEKEHKDLVVLDIMMPKMDGYEFIRVLWKSDNNLPILLVSAKQLPEGKRKGIMVGTDGYITKSMDM